MEKKDCFSAVIAESLRGIESLMVCTLESRKAVSNYLIKAQWDTYDRRREELSRIKELHEEITECYCRILGYNIMENCLK